MKYRKSYVVLAPLIAALMLVGCESSDENINQQANYAAEPESRPTANVEVAPAPESVEMARALVSTDTPAFTRASTDAPESGIREIEWDSLIPEGWRPDALMSEYDVENLSDDDPRAQELLDKLKDLWSEAPVVPEFEGQQVKLPGFVVPLEMDEKQVDEFLLVPYYGACIHVPPPPANQTVHVVTQRDKAFEGNLFDVVWVTGTMRVEHMSSDLAEAGYRIENAFTSPYE